MTVFNPSPESSNEGAREFFPWRGELVNHVTVDPEDRTWVVRHGCHKILHRIVVGDFDPVKALDDPPRRLFGGTKVDLALVGWAQIHSDGMTDRVHVDAPDGFDNGSFLRRFARIQGAGGVRMTFYPSLEEERFTRPRRLRLDRSGRRVPVTAPGRSFRRIPHGKG